MVQIQHDYSYPHRSFFRFNRIRSRPQSTVHGLNFNVIGPSELNSTVAICRCERIPVGRVFITKIFVFYFIAIIMNQLEISFFRSVTIEYDQPFLTPSDSSFRFSSPMNDWTILKEPSFQGLYQRAFQYSQMRTRETEPSSERTWIFTNKWNFSWSFCFSILGRLCGVSL